MTKQNETNQKACDHIGQSKEKNSERGRQSHVFVLVSYNSHQQLLEFLFSVREFLGSLLEDLGGSLGRFGGGLGGMSGVFREMFGRIFVGENVKYSLKPINDSSVFLVVLSCR